jgi:MFS family permease
MSIKKNSHLIGWIICLIGALFYCYEYLLRIQPSVMVTDLMKQFNVAATGFGLISVFYYYAYTPMQLGVGVLIDRFGSKLMIGLGAIACTLGSFFFSISESIYLAAFARFLMGLGSSFAFVGVLKLGAEWLPKHHFAFFVGLTTSLGMIGGMFGDIALTSLTSKIGWRETQHLGTWAGVLLVPIIFFFVHDTPLARSSSIKTPTSFSKTFAGLKQMIKNKQMWYCGIIANALYLSLGAFAELWGIKFLETTYSLDPSKASLACSMIFLGWLVGGPISGWVSDHIKSRKNPIIIGCFLSMFVIVTIILKPFNFSYEMLMLLLFLFGLFSSAQIICFAISRESNPNNIAATSLAFINFLVMLGGFIFQPLIGVLLDFFWGGTLVENVRIYSEKNYQVVFMIIPIFLCIAIFFSFKLTDTLKTGKIKK